MTLEITDQNYASLLPTDGQPTIIDFMADWCAPCKPVGVILEALSNEYKDQVVIGKVNVDINPELVSKFGIRNMPTILYLKGGEVLDKQVGATSKRVLEEKLRVLL